MYSDREGQYIETAADFGFIGYDVYRLAKDGKCNLGENLAALGLDVLGAILPVVTGLGPASRVGSKYGSYTNKYASGKLYHGKGSPSRSQRTGQQIAKKNSDPHVSTDWTPSANEREAFKDEARRIKNDGGVRNPNNYNKNNSPGLNYLLQDGEQ
jgi:hypothetical protein